MTFNVFAHTLKYVDVERLFGNFNLLDKFQIFKVIKIWPKIAVVSCFYSVASKGI